MRPLHHHTLPSVTRDNSKKRYGWCRLYDDFYSHPRWRVVAARVARNMPPGTFVAGPVDFSLVTVGMIVIALFNSTSKARQRGYLGDIDFDVIAAALNLPAEIVANAYRTLGELGWLEHDQIVDWLDRQPDHEDPTAAERQRNKRARAKAKRAVAMGMANEADHALASRVTEGGPPRLPTVVPELALVAPRSEQGEDIAAADAHNRLIARAWLLGGGMEDFGPASAIVARQLRQLRTSAQETILRWLNEIGGDVVALAQIIDGAEATALTREAFENVVRQRIAERVRELENGAPLPFGPTAIRGGRRNAG